MRRSFFTMRNLVLLLSAVCVLLAAALIVARPQFYWLALAALALAVLAVLLFSRHVNHILKGILQCGLLRDETERLPLDTFGMPVLMLEEKNIIWYNDSFLAMLLDGHDQVLCPISTVLPGLESPQYLSADGQNVEKNGEKYTVYGMRRTHSSITVMYFIRDTLLKAKAAEYDASRPAVLHIALDTYDELKKDLRVSDLGRISGEVQDAVLHYIGRYKGLVHPTAGGRWLAVVEESAMQKMIEERFSLLDTVRGIGGEIGVTTLSIGVGRLAGTFGECEDMAVTALDMAMGRGGDQAAVREQDTYTFYGGVSRSVEKRNKVKARIIASALRELILSSDSVVIMGHRMADMDCIGAATGVLRICKKLDKPACVAIDKAHTLAKPLLDRLDASGVGEDFISPEEAKRDITANTLLIIVDTHVPGLLESRELFDAISRRVVIDHHRKMVGFIDDATVFYHETYASSACELVSELLPYLIEKDDLQDVEADALLAGIVLDTRQFTVHTGVRTFEAAGYLRRMGAATANVKKLFASTLDAYQHKAALVTRARIYRGCAVVVSESLPEDMMVVIPQAANDLLNIEGVKASFVAVRIGQEMNISARSMGEVNVQVIMETLGGGGHMMMAAAQLSGVTPEMTEAYIKQAIDEYWKHTKA